MTSATAACGNSYLQLCEVGYRRLGWMVFQAQLAKRVFDAVPL